MVTCNTLTCPNCGGTLKHYDSVSRIIRTKGRTSDYLRLRRLKCSKCGVIHREIPEEIYPYKQYEAELINGVLEGFITSNTMGYEDYPCEMTMNRWKSQSTYFEIYEQLRLEDLYNLEVSDEFIFFTQN